jgi:hypothetical protein
MVKGVLARSRPRGHLSPQQAGPPACSGLPSHGPRRSALAAWVPEWGCGGALLPAPRSPVPPPRATHAHLPEGDVRAATLCTQAATLRAQAATLCTQAYHPDGDFMSTVEGDLAPRALHMSVHVSRSEEMIRPGRKSRWAAAPVAAAPDAQGVAVAEGAAGGVGVHVSPLPRAHAKAKLRARSKLRASGATKG